MFWLGHMGIGSKLVSPWTKNLPYRVVLIGTVFPDILDKSLYYGLSWMTGKRGADLGLISGTQTFGHTAFLTSLVIVAALVRKSKVLAALSLGMMSHLLIDNVLDHFAAIPDRGLPTTLDALLWPLHGTQFPVYPFQNLQAHLLSIHRPEILWGEVIGGALLFWEIWKRRHRWEIFRQEKHLKSGSSSH